MSDYDRAKAFFDSIGLGYTAGKSSAFTKIINEEKELAEYFIELNDANNKVSAYDGLFALFYFNEKGKFIKAGIWE